MASGRNSAPCPASRNLTSNSPNTWISRASSALRLSCAVRHSAGSNKDCRFARGKGAAPGGTASSSSSGSGRNHRSSSSPTGSSSQSLCPAPRHNRDGIFWTPVSLRPPPPEHAFQSNSPHADPISRYVPTAAQGSILRTASAGYRGDRTENSSRRVQMFKKRWHCDVARNGDNSVPMISIS